MRLELNNNTILLEKDASCQRFFVLKAAAEGASCQSLTVPAREKGSDCDIGDFFGKKQF
jgi:hypothetical protein